MVELVCLVNGMAPKVFQALHDGYMLKNRWHDRYNRRKATHQALSLFEFKPVYYRTHPGVEEQDKLENSMPYKAHYSLGSFLRPLDEIKRVLDLALTTFDGS